MSSCASSVTPRPDGAFAGHATAQAQRRDIAPVTRDRGLQDCDDAEALAARERRQQAALRDAEDRRARHLPRGMKAGVRESRR